MEAVQATLKALMRHFIALEVSVKCRSTDKDAYVQDAQYMKNTILSEHIFVRKGNQNEMPFI